MTQQPMHRVPSSDPFTKKTPNEHLISSERIDQECDRFEQAWRAGERPKLESYLQGTPPKLRKELLYNLLLVELECSNASLTESVAIAYERRFEGDESVVQRALAALEGSQPDHKRDEASIGTLNAVPASHKQLRFDEGTEALGAGPASTANTDIPSQIANYQVLDLLGRGGMGVVFRARQLGTGRLVALKVLDAERLVGLPQEARRDAIERFRTEAIAAASLNHDHIVTVFEVGEFSDRPFLSMHYVEGDSLMDAVRQGPMPSRMAAKYLEPVARAIHVAHLNGVVHRDLKPSNLLRDKQLDRVLVADFGLAKLANADRQVTRTGAMFGSPPYMSPEQVADSTSVGSGTDIYSLGATLYHLITGRPPFMADSMATTLHQVLAELPALPRALNPAVDRDLETICLKCLEKDIQRRYQTAADLADDLQRYLRYEPIQARPISLFGRFHRWCVRNRSLAAILATATLLLVTATVIATWGYFGAVAARNREHEQRLELGVQKEIAEEQKANAETQRTIAEQQKDIAESNFQLARDVIEQAIIRITDDPSLQQAGLERFRLDSLISAKLFYEDLVKANPGNVLLRVEQIRALRLLANLYREMGDLAAAEESYGLAVASQNREPIGESANASVELALSKMGLGRLYQQRGELDLAEQQLMDAITDFKRAAELIPGSSEYQRQYAEAQSHLAELYLLTNRLEQAEPLILAAEKIRDRLIERDLDTNLHRIERARSHHQLANLYLAKANYRSAEGECLQALTMAQSLPETTAVQGLLATSHRQLAEIYHAVGRHERSQRHYEDAVLDWEQLCREHREIPEYLGQLAAAESGLAITYLTLGERELAESKSRGALRRCEQLVSRWPNVPAHDAQLAQCCIALSEVLLAGSATDESERLLNRAAEIYERLTDAQPKIPEYSNQLARVLRSTAEVAITLADWESVTGKLEAAQEIRRELLSEYPELQSYRTAIGRTYLVRADAEFRRHNFAQAKTALESAIDTLKRGDNDVLSIPECRFVVAQAHLKLARLPVKTAGDLSFATKHYQQGIRTLEALAEECPGAVAYQFAMAESYFHWAGISQSPDDRRLVLERAAAIWNSFRTPDWPPNNLFRTAECYARLGRLAFEMNQIDKAITSYEQGAAALDEFLRRKPRDRYASQMRIGMRAERDKLIRLRNDVSN